MWLRVAQERGPRFLRNILWNCNIAMFWSHGQWTDLQLSENFRSNKFCSVLGDCFHICPSVVMCRSFHMITWHMTWETTCPFARLHIMSGLCSECLVGSSRSAMFPSINQSEAILDWICTSIYHNMKHCNGWPWAAFSHEVVMSHWHMALKLLTNTAVALQQAF